jgi:predicted ABC-type sugar transport system permease subunit
VYKRQSPGAVVGALLIEVIRHSLILLGISTFWQGMPIGTFIVIASAFDRLRQLRSRAAKPGGGADGNGRVTA